MRQSHQRFPHADSFAVDDSGAQREPPGGKDDDRRPVLEPAHLFALGEMRLARNHIGAAIADVQQDIDEMQADAGDQDGGDRDQQDALATRREGGFDQRPLVLAEQPFNPLQCDRIDVPGVAGNVSHLMRFAVGRGVEAVVHAGSQAQCDVAAVSVTLDQLGVAQQVEQGIGETLGLDQLSAGNLAAGTDDAVARADKDIGIGVYRPRIFI